MLNFSLIPIPLPLFILLVTLTDLTLRCFYPKQAYSRLLLTLRVAPILLTSL